MDRPYDDVVKEMLQLREQLRRASEQEDTLRADIEEWRNGAAKMSREIDALTAALLSAHELLNGYLKGAR